MLFLLWCSCVTVWCASPDRVSRCVEVRPAKKVFARPLHALWSKYESKKRGNMSYIQQGGGKKSKKKKGKNKPSSIYSAISPFQRFVSLPCLLDFIRKAVDGKEKYARVVEVRVCWRLCFVLDVSPAFFFYGAQWVQRVFFVVLTLLRRNGVGAWKAP